MLIPAAVSNVGATDLGVLVAAIEELSWNSKLILKRVVDCEERLEQHAARLKDLFQANIREKAVSKGRSSRVSRDEKKRRNAVEALRATLLKHDTQNHFGHLPSPRNSARFSTKVVNVASDTPLDDISPPMPVTVAEPSVLEMAARSESASAVAVTPPKSELCEDRHWSRGLEYTVSWRSTSGCADLHDADESVMSRKECSRDDRLDLNTPRMHCVGLNEEVDVRVDPIIPSDTWPERKALEEGKLAPIDVDCGLGNSSKVTVSRDDSGYTLEVWPARRALNVKEEKSGIWKPDVCSDLDHDPLAFFADEVQEDLAVECLHGAKEDVFRTRICERKSEPRLAVYERDEDLDTSDGRAMGSPAGPAHGGGGRTSIRLLEHVADHMVDMTHMASFNPLKAPLERLASMNHILSDLRAKISGDIFDTHPSVKEILDSASTVHLKQSVWDVTLFVFYRPLGHSTNWTMLIPFVLTVMLQCSFLCGVVAFIVRWEDSPAMLRDDFAEWRRVADLDVVVAVCSGDASLASSFKQASTYDACVAYTETLFDSGHDLLSAGPFMSFLVCAAWILTILKELGNVLDKILGVWQATLVNTRAIDLEVFKTSVSSGFHILSLPLHRTVWFLLICLLEGIIAVLLLIAGLEWLISTTDIVDLLLNGVAIAYIMNFDELIYDVFIPGKIATVVSLLEPLPARWPSCFPLRGFVLAVVGVLAIATAISQIDTQFKEAVLLRDTLCP